MMAPIMAFKWAAGRPLSPFKINLPIKHLAGHDSTQQKHFSVTRGTPTIRKKHRSSFWSSLGRGDALLHVSLSADAISRLVGIDSVIVNEFATFEVVLLYHELLALGRPLSLPLCVWQMNKKRKGKATITLDTAKNV